MWWTPELALCWVDLQASGGEGMLDVTPSIRELKRGTPTRDIINVSYQAEPCESGTESGPQVTKSGWNVRAVVKEEPM